MNKKRREKMSYNFQCVQNDILHKLEESSEDEILQISEEDCERLYISLRANHSSFDHVIISARLLGVILDKICPVQY